MTTAMRATIRLDDVLMWRAARLTGLKSKREIVHRGLEAPVRLKEQEKIRRYRGKLRWHGDLAGSREG
jgi:Arc/MetJ family transcription regulator